MNLANEKLNFFHPIMIGIENNDAVLYINGEPVGFCKSVNFHADKNESNYIPKLDIERIVISKNRSISEKISSVSEHCLISLKEIFNIQ